MRKIIRDNPIVKPKIERLQLQHGVSPEDLADFVGPKHFLQKYQGVKQRTMNAQLDQQRKEDREKRTFSKFELRLSDLLGIA